MNFLAHAYLSFGNRQILVGNMISDFVKGAQKETYDWDVRQGILLHRAIDSYTDTHDATAEAKEFFRPHYRLYSGAIIDIVYDHFLAADTNIFTREDDLLSFAHRTYQTLEEHHHILPAHFARMLPYMKQDNWLHDYRTTEGAGRSLMRMVRRAAYISDSETAFHILLEHYRALQACYARFFPDVVLFATKKIAELKS
jgi:acyl carrier protein phosphodiesterase